MTSSVYEYLDGGSSNGLMQIFQACRLSGVLDSLLSLVVAVLLVMVPTFMPLMLCVEAAGVSYALSKGLFLRVF